MFVVSYDCFSGPLCFFSPLQKCRFDVGVNYSKYGAWFNFFWLSQLSQCYESHICLEQLFVAYFVKRIRWLIQWLAENCECLWPANMQHLHWMPSTAPFMVVFQYYFFFVCLDDKLHIEIWWVPRVHHSFNQHSFLTITPLHATSASSQSDLISALHTSTTFLKVA